MPAYGFSGSRPKKPAKSAGNASGRWWPCFRSSIRCMAQTYSANANMPSWFTSDMIQTLLSSSSDKLDFFISGFAASAERKPSAFMCSTNVLAYFVKLAEETLHGDAPAVDTGSAGLTGLLVGLPSLPGAIVPLISPCRYGRNVEGSSCGKVAPSRRLRTKDIKHRNSSKTNWPSPSRSESCQMTAKSSVARPELTSNSRASWLPTTPVPRLSKFLNCSL
mmetsp:Transcript_42302/g.76704  ORF Transcript_42302/g.76704 Transcript_42302/m.76704 type:complete len:220 (+) Transcript_42302:754-1413(+)